MPSSNSNAIKRLNEEYEDRLFKLIMNNASEKNGKLVDKDIEQLNNHPENLPSQADIKRFSKLLDIRLKRSESSQRARRMPRLTGRIAVAMIVIMIAFFGTVLTVQAFRVQVLNFLISIEPKYTSLQLTDTDDPQSDGKLIVNWANAYVPTYIPDGYEINNISYSDSIKEIMFTRKDDNSFITYSEFDPINSVSIDTEGASLIETISINGHDGTLSIKDSVTSVAWSMDNHLYIIQGQINRDEAVKMAEGVKFVN